MLLPGSSFRHGFTLVEVLAALMFLAILVPAIVGGLTLGNRISELSERKAIAVRLAENKLNEQLIGSAWQTVPAGGGDFTAQGYPDYKWQVTQQNWQGDSVNYMTELDVEITFPVQGNSHSVRLATLANGTAQATPSPSPPATSSEEMTPAQPFFIPWPAMPSGRRCEKDAFTLIEIMLAAIAASLILASIYGIFYRAIKLRDNATDRSREARIRERAVNVIRNDLQNALISGGILASTLEGDSNGTDGSDQGSPGYLKLTTTTGKDPIATGTTVGQQQMYGDVQQVEYYLARNPAGSAMSGSRTLVRVVTRDLLDTNETVVDEEQLLPNVKSFQVSFYDGTQWQTSWTISGTSTTGSSTSSTSASSSSGTNGQTLPAAIRVDIQPAAPLPPEGSAYRPAASETPPALCEILMQWETAPFLSGTNFTIGSGTISPLPTE